MRLKTIWTTPAISFNERFRRTRECLAMEFGARLPLRIRYWTAIQEIAYATRDSKNIPATPLDEILRDLRRPKEMT